MTKVTAVCLCTWQSKLLHTSASMVQKGQAALRQTVELTLTHLQMGVHEEELMWLEERVKIIKAASGSGISTHHTGV